MNEIERYNYYYNVPFEFHGSKFPFVKTKRLTREEFIRITGGIDPSLPNNK